jgi:hypothetical protein
MNFFHKPSEIASCLKELKIIEDKITSTLFSSMAFNIIKPYVVKQIKNKEKTIYSIRNDKISPQNLVLLIITNVIAELLPTGQYHIYRGILNMEGQGLLELWHYAVDELQKSGFYTAEEAKEDNVWIEKQIKEVG